MDETTLLAQRELWGSENKPETRELTRFRSDEQIVYRALLDGKYAPKLRLEQEPIGFEYLEAALAGLDRIVTKARD